jgi:hypothetical protein
MSLRAWIALYIFNRAFFGLMWFRRQNGKPAARSRRYAFALMLAFITVWFFVGLFFPETRFFIGAQPNS